MFFILLSGSVAVGTQAVSDTGSYFGEQAILKAHKAADSVIATSDDVSGRGAEMRLPPYSLGKQVFTNEFFRAVFT